MMQSLSSSFSQRFLTVVLVLVLGVLVGVTPSQAVTVPTFPSCENPTGQLKVSYASGVHGIPGRSEEFRGSDAVYTINDEMLIQCFCPDPGTTGIKTDWWKVTELSEIDQKILKKSGWIYIPNGSLWGLDPVPYFARNTNYVCRSSGGGNGGGGNGGGSTSSSNGGGNVLGSSTSYPQILGLAATGKDPQQFAAFGAIASSALATLYYFSKRS